MSLAAPIIALLLAVTARLLLTRLPAAGLGEWSGYLHVAVGCALWLGAAWFGRRLLALVVTQYAARRLRSRRSSLMIHGGPQLMIDLGGLAFFVGAILGIVALVFRQPLGGLLATSGVFAAIIGFAMQRMISDVFSGLALNVERPFAIGDWIELSTGTIGKVADANWRAVHLTTIEGKSVVVPNSVLSGNQFINFNRPERSYRIKRNICLDYGVPIERAITILQSAMEMTRGMPASPPPLVIVEQFGEYGVVYSLNYWVPDYPDSFAITQQVSINALKCLDQAGFAPAYPKRDVTMSEGGPRHIEYRVDLFEVLRRVPLLQPLDDDSIRDLQGRVRLQEFPAGRAIVQEGEPGQSLYLVISGMLEATQRAGGTEARGIGRLAAGEVFGEMSLLTGVARNATVTALAPVVLAEIRKEDLEPILAAHPAIITQLSEIEARRMLANIAAGRPAEEAREESRESGFAAALRERILRFFGQAKAIETE